MLRSKEYEQYAKWLEYWMSKIPQRQGAVEESPFAKMSNFLESITARRQSSGARDDPKSGPNVDRTA